MRRIGVEERRARLGLRHRLAAEDRAEGPEEAARAVVALHATDPASVYLAVAARTGGLEVEAVERALYEERTLLRLLGMRRTMFVATLDAASVIQAACAGAIAARERRTLDGLLASKDDGRDRAAHLAMVEEATLRALAARGEATGAELSGDVPELREEFPYGEGTAWAGVQRLTTRLLGLLGAEGRVVRGRPRGSWLSSQHRWTPLERWLPGGLEPWDEAAARTELVRRWLAAFGPGTTTDLRWWTGWPARDVADALGPLDIVEVKLDSGPGLVLADDLDPAPPAEPWVALLPALDPTVMGWKERAWYLGEHAPTLFDTAGNAGPTVWCAGRVVGGWGQPESGEVVVRLLEDVGAEAAARIEVAAERLSAAVGGVRVSPRFRTPLERELSS
ncbi:MAG TPA: winged helix DNA-binding domain-containing protein [Gaiellaceae bacterium]|nr:winged helix DNA-binding domain-containing protein [Gaiellaceae bacterium]